MTERRFTANGGSIIVMPSENGRGCLIGFDNEDGAEPHWVELGFVTARLMALSVMQITNDAQARAEEELRSAQIERSSHFGEQ